MLHEFIGIAGAGRVAQALGRLLHSSGEPVAAVASRSAARAGAAAAFVGPDVKAVRYEELPSYVTRLLIAVPDDAITAVAQILAEGGMKEGAAVHTCGAYGVEVLAPLAARGVACATLHPLQTVSSPEQGVTALRGCAFAISGEGRGVVWAGQIVRLLGGRPLTVRLDGKPAYHAAAVMASNYVIVLIDAALRLMEAAGIAPEEALPALGPLIRSSTENALLQGPTGALTGPVERGDVQTVALHLNALNAARVPAEIFKLYRAAGKYALQIARRRGLPADLAGQLEELLKRRDLHHGESSKTDSRA